MQELEKYCQVCGSELDPITDECDKCADYFFSEPDEGCELFMDEEGNEYA